MEEKKIVEIRYTDEERRLNRLYVEDGLLYEQYCNELTMGGFCIERSPSSFGGVRSHLIWKYKPDVIDGADTPKPRYRSHQYLTGEEKEFLFNQLKGK